jgi:AraC-like DNA-binding protein
MLPQTRIGFRFSSSDLPASERARAIRQLRERGLLPVEPLGERSADVSIVKRFLPSIGILSATLCGVRQDGGRPGDLDGDDLFLGMNLAGRCVVAQRGREIEPRSNDAVFVDPAAGAFAIVRPTPGRFLGLRIARSALAPLMTGRDAGPMRLVPAASCTLRLLRCYARTLLRSGAAPPQAAHIVARHLVDLVALSIDAGRHDARHEATIRAARLHAIKADILANLTDGGLTIAAIAARHRVSPRYIHKLFESEQLTFSRFVLAQRLEQAYRALRNHRDDASSISAIAYGVGFGDLSYFNRTFRLRYGATPSDVRDGSA